jgi:hypothetical protein
MEKKPILFEEDRSTWRLPKPTPRTSKGDAMQISALQSLSVSGQQVNAANNGMAQFKKNFDAIGDALESGDLPAAKKAYEQLQTSAPSKGDGNDPMGKMMKALGEAIESGDLDAAKEQYAKIKEEMAKNPPGGKGSRGGKGGAAPAGGSSSEDSYDVRDANKDGTVSMAEQIAYDLKQQQAKANDEAQSTATETGDTVQESIDVQA